MIKLRKYFSIESIFWCFKIKIIGPSRLQEERCIFDPEFSLKFLDISSHEILPIARCSFYMFTDKSQPNKIKLKIVLLIIF